MCVFINIFFLLLTLYTKRLTQQNTDEPMEFTFTIQKYKYKYK